MGRGLMQDIEQIKKTITIVMDLPVLKSTISFLLVCYSWVFGIDNDGAISVLLLIIIDTLTGFIRSYKNKDLNSYDFYKFAYKIFTYFILVVTAKLVDKVVLGSFACLIVETFLAVTEALSIIENLSQLGVPIPKILVERLKYLRDRKFDKIKGDNDDI